MVGVNVISANTPSIPAKFVDQPPEPNIWADGLQTFRDRGFEMPITQGRRLSLSESVGKQLDDDSRHTAGH